MAKRNTRNKGKDYIFLPDHLDQVTAIAMRGSTEDEMAATFGIPPELMQKWKHFYPSFKEAIEKGRTKPDAAVVRSLYQNATGFEYEEDMVVPGGRGSKASVLTVRKFQKPDTQAQKFWLSSRQGEYWGDQSNVRVSGRKGEPPIGVSDETKRQLMSSILAMIRSKPDGDPAQRE